MRKLAVLDNGMSRLFSTFFHWTQVDCRIW